MTERCVYIVTGPLSPLCYIGGPYNGRRDRLRWLDLGGTSKAVGSTPPTGNRSLRQSCRDDSPSNVDSQNYSVLGRLWLLHLSEAVVHSWHTPRVSGLPSIMLTECLVMQTRLLVVMITGCLLVLLRVSSPGSTVPHFHSHQTWGLNLS